MIPIYNISLLAIFSDVILEIISLGFFLVALGLEFCLTIARQVVLPLAPLCQPLELISIQARKVNWNSQNMMIRHPCLVREQW